MNTKRHAHQCTIGLAMLGLASLAACGRSEGTPVPGDRNATTNIVSQPVVPAPPGNSAIQPADDTTRQAVEKTDQAGKGGAGSQSTVGTAASGAPPYTLNGAPEANVAPKQGAAPKK